MSRALPYIVLRPNNLTLNKKIQAIKDVRAATKLGLKEAKEVVDRCCANSQHGTFVYDRDLGIDNEFDMDFVFRQLDRSENIDVEIHYPPDPAADNDPFRGVAHEAAILAAVFAAQEKSVQGALMKVTDLATVLKDPTFQAAKIILGEAHDRVNGRVTTPLLANGYDSRPFA